MLIQLIELLLMMFARLKNEPSIDLTPPALLAPATRGQCTLLRLRGGHLCFGFKYSTIQQGKIKISTLKRGYRMQRYLLILFSYFRPVRLPGFFSAPFQNPEGRIDVPLLQV